MIPSLSVLANFSGPGGGGGGGGGAVSIDNRSVSKFGGGGAPVTATYTLSNNGNVYNQNGTVLETWLDSGVASSYDVRATLSSGDAPGGDSLATWLNLNLPRSWSLSAVAGENFTCTLLVEIRPAGGGATIDSATINITADNTA